MSDEPTRRDLWFDSHGDRCAAWVFTPRSGDLKPAVVLAPLLAGVRSAAVDRFAAHFARAGLVSLVFDYRGFGDSCGSPRQVMRVRPQLRDWHSAVAAARRLPEVDAARVALWGGSITGGHVLRVAAEDPTIACVVSHVPLVDGLSSTAAVRPFPRQQARLLAAGARDGVRGLLRRAPRYLPVIGPPGTLAVLTSPDAEPDYRALLPARWDNRIAARAALSILAYRPGWSARKIRCPVLLTLAADDAITPPRRAQRLVSRAPDVQIRWYPARHFESFASPAADAMLEESTAFLTRHLLG